MKKLERIVWNPAPSSVTPGITSRIVLGVVEVAEIRDPPLVDRPASSTTADDDADAPTIRPRLQRHRCCRRTASAADLRASGPR